MNKRLRKKKRRGEYTELGFALSADLRPGLSPAALDAFVDRFIAEIDARQLCFGGGFGDTLAGFVTRDGRASATEDDRALLSAFLAGDADVLAHEVGPLRDAWR